MQTSQMRRERAAEIALALLSVIVTVSVSVSGEKSILKPCDGSKGYGLKNLGQVEIDKCPDASEKGYCELKFEKRMDFLVDFKFTFTDDGNFEDVIANLTVGDLYSRAESPTDDHKSGYYLKSSGSEHTLILSPDLSGRFVASGMKEAEVKISDFRHDYPGPVLYCAKFPVKIVNKYQDPIFGFTDDEPIQDESPSNEDLIQEETSTKNYPIQDSNDSNDSKDFNDSNDNPAQDETSSNDAPIPNPTFFSGSFMERLMKYLRAFEKESNQSN